MNRREFDKHELPKLLSKKADVKEWLQGAMNHVRENPSIVPLGLAAGGAALGGIKSHMDSRTLSKAQERSFTEAVKMFPELQHEDPMKLKQLVATMHQMAPHVATNPQVLGTFLKAQTGSTSMHVGAQDLLPYQELESGLVGGHGYKQEPQGLVDQLSSKVRSYSTLGEATGLMKNIRKGQEGGKE